MWPYDRHNVHMMVYFSALKGKEFLMLATKETKLRTLYEVREANHKRANAV